MATGALVAVVGPSGAGKDTLLAAAREALAADQRFVFPRRIVTRAAVAAIEDHDSIDRAGFAAASAAGQYALDWEAHGLCYALPASIGPALAEGRIVVVNMSRRVIAAARQRFGRVVVVLVTAEPATRAQRLAGRGRESAEEVAARLAHEGAPLPEDSTPFVIDNSGTVGSGAAALVEVLQQIAAG